VLLTSFELGIFTAIGDGPKESREIAQTLGTSERATDRLMNALCGMGFLKKRVVDSRTRRSQPDIL